MVFVSIPAKLKAPGLVATTWLFWERRSTNCPSSLSWCTTQTRDASSIITLWLRYLTTCSGYKLEEVVLVLDLTPWWAHELKCYWFVIDRWYLHKYYLFLQWTNWSYQINMTFYTEMSLFRYFFLEYPAFFILFLHYLGLNQCLPQLSKKFKHFFKF